MAANLQDPMDVARRTAWGEARDQGVSGMQAVMNTLANRAAKPSWWGEDIVTCALHPWQYSCWNADDPNRAKLLAVDESDQQLSEATKLAQALVAGELPDLTAGADSYYRVNTRIPQWATTAELTCGIGAHLFFITRP